ncbi:MAG: TIGR04282 family arsenosugar biosynthesis glycosyltransferase [Gammaproteobacteria bacterium]|nr:TIGR04282 family arsenosugar biosynthesis glycosyltransferase [Gammaproteobacteria bacterium]
MTFKYPDAVLLVFAKAPVAGTVNTRLIPDIGVEAATELQSELVHSRLSALKASKLCEVQLWCAPDCEHDFFQRCKNSYEVTLHQQQGADLGERMAQAIKANLKKFKRVVLIGTDAPSLSTEQIESALKKLGEANDIVIVPAEDGGYVLIGMSRPCDAVFQSVPWGSDKVLTATHENIRQNNLTSAELEPCWDIDRVEDYWRYKKSFSPD